MHTAVPLLGPVWIGRLRTLRGRSGGIIGDGAGDEQSVRRLRPATGCHRGALTIGSPPASPEHGSHPALSARVCGTMQKRAEVRYRPGCQRVAGGLDRSARPLAFAP
jgi:hypothetical protein